MRRVLSRSVGSTFDVTQLDKRVRRADLDSAAFELTALVREVAVALNVIELSPRGRIVVGSTAHMRLLVALARLIARLDALDEARQLDDVDDAEAA